MQPSVQAPNVTCMLHGDMGYVTSLNAEFKGVTQLFEFSERREGHFPINHSVPLILALQ